MVTDATFDPATDTWTVLDYDCVGSAIGVWDGQLVISGRGSHALDPSTGQCYAFPDSVIAEDFSDRRAGDTRVWTGRELILWSGDQGGEGGPPKLDAVSFTPAER